MMSGAPVMRLAASPNSTVSNSAGPGANAAMMGARVGGSGDCIPRSYARAEGEHRLNRVMRSRVLARRIARILPARRRYRPPPRALVELQTKQRCGAIECRRACLRHAERHDAPTCIGRTPRRGRVVGVK